MQVSGLDEKKARCERELEARKKQLEEAKKRADAASENYTKISLDFSELELKKDEYINGGHTEAETKSYYARVNDVKRQLDRGLEDSEQKRRKKDELSNHSAGQIRAAGKGRSGAEGCVQGTDRYKDE